MNIQILRTVFCIVLLSGSALAKKSGVFLIIANKDNLTGTLRTPIEEGRVFAQIFAKCPTIDFSYIAATDSEFMICNNLGRDSMDAAIRKFQEVAKQKDYAVFYFAGHGLMSKGLQYMVPTDAEIFEDSEMSEIAKKCVSIESVVTATENCNEGGLCIISACSDIIDDDSARETLEHRNHQLKKTYLAFSASPSELTQDGEAGSYYSPFAEKLISNLQNGKNVLDALDNTGKWLTDNFSGQRPIVIGNPTSLIRKVRFVNEGPGEEYDTMWINNLDQATALARNSDTELLIYLDAQWCPFSRAFESEVLKSAGFRHWANSRVLSRVKDSAEDTSGLVAALMNKYEISGFPAAILLDSGGKFLGKTVGHLKGSGVDSWIQEIEPERLERISDSQGNDLNLSLHHSEVIAESEGIDNYLNFKKSTYDGIIGKNRIKVNLNHYENRTLRGGYEYTEVDDEKTHVVEGEYGTDGAMLLRKFSDGVLHATVRMICKDLGDSLFTWEGEMEIKGSGTKLPIKMWRGKNSSEIK